MTTIARGSHAPRTWLRRLGITAGALGALAFCAVWIRAEQGLREGERLLKRGAFPQARAQLGRFLWFHPRHEQALFLMAQALATDESLDDSGATTQALDLLARIPDSSPRAAEARSREGRLLYFVMHKPVAAERAFRKAVELDPDYIEAWYLLMKLLDGTARSSFAEPVFWRLYELTPPVDRPILLREWYMSQFFPATSNPIADIQMGFSNPTVPYQLNPEYVRLREFRDAEPDQPATHAALARWFQYDGDHHTALEVLQRGLDLPGAFDDAFFVATLVHSLFETGEHDKAREAFDKWPAPREGYEYWKWKAILTDEVDRNFTEALPAYDQCLATWPGPADWRTMFRKANCLSRARLAQQAEEVRQLAKQRELQLETELHRELREALGDHHLQNPDMLRKVQGFYAALGRDREVACWQWVIDQLPEKRE